MAIDTPATRCIVYMAIEFYGADMRQVIAAGVVGGIHYEKFIWSRHRNQLLMIVC